MRLIVFVAIVSNTCTNIHRDAMQPTSHAKELVFAAALACSAAMGLPVSKVPLVWLRTIPFPRFAFVLILCLLSFDDSFSKFQVSGFPNMTAVSIEDSLGNRLVNTSDFLRYAVAASLFSWFVLITLGYWLITLAVEM